MVAKTKENEAEAIDFESALNELEKVVNELDGEVKLDKALALFERGMQLSGQCQTFLQAAEQKVELLKRNAQGAVAVEPFEDQSADEEDYDDEED